LAIRSFLTIDAKLRSSGEVSSYVGSIVEKAFAGRFLEQFPFRGDR